MKKDKKKDKHMDKKWKSLEKRGLTRPSGPEENRARALAAHAG